MKARQFLFFVGLSLCVVFFSACQNQVDYHIQFRMNGANDIPDLIVKDLASFSLPDEPTYEGYTFGGWFFDEKLEEPLDDVKAFESIEGKSITLYAKWVEVDSQLTLQLKAIYNLALSANAYEGTYEEWLASIQGPRGERGADGNDGIDGKDAQNIALSVFDGYIQWHYIGDRIFHPLISLMDLTGKQGSDGREVEFRLSNDHIQWKYLEDDEWIDLISLAILRGVDGKDGIDGMNGTDGREALFRVAQGFIQWQYQGDNAWMDLIEVSSLTGLDGISIDRMEINTLGELLIYYSNGVMSNIGSFLKYHQITFIGFHGYIIDYQLVPYESTVIAPSVIEVLGYTFLGWDQDLDDITSDMRVVAIYEKNKYQITFDSQGGEEIGPFLDIEFGSCITLPILVKPGYTFMGWYRGLSVNDGQFTNSTPIDQDLNLYARWLSQQHIVTFLDYDETILSEVFVSSGNPAIPPDEPLREGYTFIGWDSSYESITSSIELRAVYHINTYTITFDTGIHPPIDAITLDYGSTITIPSNPVILGYQFVGWYSEPTFENTFSVSFMPASDITLYGKWDSITYSITYDLDSGAFESMALTSYYVTDSFDLSIPTKTGYRFIGWYDNPEFEGTSIDSLVLGTTGDRNFYALWQLNEVTITYEVNCGTEILPLTGIAGESYLEPMPPLRLAYLFVGWYLDFDFSEVAEFIVIPDQNTTLYAKWAVDFDSPYQDAVTKSIYEVIESYDSGDFDPSMLISVRGILFHHGSNRYSLMEQDKLVSLNIYQSEIVTIFNALPNGSTVEVIGTLRSFMGSAQLTNIQTDSYLVIHIPEEE